MNLNRRSLFKSALAVAAVSVVPMGMAGCSGDTTIGVLNTIIAGAQAILNVAEPGAAWLADFNQAVTAVIQAETQWQSGSPAQIVVSTLNTLAAAAGVIPFTAPYAGLANILVASIDKVISTLSPTVAPTAAAHADAAIRTREQARGPQAIAVVNAHRGQVTLRQPRKVAGIQMQSQTSAVKEQWNDYVDANVGAHPELAKARLQ